MLFFDIETNGLLDDLTKIHCIRAFDSEHKLWMRFDADHLPIEAGVKALADADCLVGHNIIAFDVPALQKVYPWFRPKGRLLDTLVYCRLANGDVSVTDYGLWRQGRLPGQLIGRHSLEAWGYRIGALKGDYFKSADWREYSPEMGDYCERDVVVTMALWDWLSNKTMSRQAIELELAVQAIIARQERHGFPFDISSAERLYAALLEENERVLGEAKTLFGPFYRWNGKVFTPARDNDRLGYTKGASCCPISLVEFNPLSNQHVYYFLLKQYGWIPEEFTEKSELPLQFRPAFEPYYRANNIEGWPEPKIDYDILSRLTYPAAPILSRLALLQKRLGQIGVGEKSWLKLYNHKTGCIHGSVNTIGAVTRRMTHYDPNIAQVPAVYSPYGRECRALFGCFGRLKDWTLIDADAASLEMRMLAHYLAAFDGGAFTEAVVKGRKDDGTDPHSINARLLGLDRDTAKTWFYAWLYGAGDAKLGRIASRSVQYSRKMREKFLKSVPGLERLVGAIKHAVKTRGCLVSIDGHPLPIRSQHSALNTLLQSAGAIVMKRALVLFDEALRSKYKPVSDYEFVLNVHDEYGLVVRPGLDPEEVGKLSVEAITEAGKFYKTRCELTGEWRAGKTWAETH